MSLFYFEIRKNFFKRSILICLLILTLLNIYKINDTYRVYGRFSHESMSGVKAAYHKLYSDKLGGEMTVGKIDFVMEQYRLLSEEVEDFKFSTEFDEARLTGYTYGDYGLFKFYFIPEMEYAFTYKNTADLIVQNATENIDFYKEINNSFAVKNNELIVKSYENRQLTDYVLTEGWERFFLYDFSALLIMLVLLLGLSPVFAGENESKMNILLNTTRFGKGKTVCAKLITSIGFITIICFYFFVMDLMAFFALFKMDGILNPIFSVKLFSLSPIAVSILEFLIINFILKTLAFCTIGGAMLLMSSLFKKVISPLIINLTLLLSLVFFSEIFGGSYLNPISLITNRELFVNFSTINIFSIPIPSFVAVSVLMLLLGLLFYSAILIKETYEAKSEVTDKWK